MSTLLLRSSWQTINIGDIAHTPGMLALLEHYLPDTEVILWASSVDNGVDELLHRSFPRLRRTVAGSPETPAIQEAFAEADFFLHGSGASVVAEAHMAAWRTQTGKPYGVYGVTIGAVSDALRDLLSGADFVFCRDTVSLQVARDAGVRCPVLEFTPDATFAFSLRDDVAAKAYLDAVGLKSGSFLCAIPRLRYTPYHQLRQTNWTPEWIATVERTNAETRENDHAKLREVIVRWVRETGLKVLACPEMTYQIPIAKELLVDPLPNDVRSQVIWRDTYWKPDEAASVYAHARAVVSFEMHSPILAFTVDTPAFYLRQPTDTSKGQMWRDIGLNRWIFEIDSVTGADIYTVLHDLHTAPDAAQRTLTHAQEFVRQRQQETSGFVAQSMERVAG
ncbi:MAG: polysaccharide pyruvyl transferase family protein [Armatimonadaceae bacterium]